MSAPRERKEGTWTTRKPFIARLLQETAGAWTDIATSYAETDTPAKYFSDVDPDTLKAGIIHRVRLRLNWANAVNLEEVRIYSAAKAGDYESRMNLLWTSDDLVANVGDDDDLDDQNLNIDFRLETEGKILIACTWSGACGNIQGFVEISGELYE